MISALASKHLIPDASPEPADGRNGSSADISPSLINFRLTPESGHCRHEVDGNIKCNNRFLWGLRRPLINAGAEPGDLAILEFDVSKHTVNLTLGGEELADVWDSGNIDLPPPEIGEMDAVASVVEGNASPKEWQPIGNAPANQDLKVRLQDALGRWTLPNPSKLIPGKGWIDGWSGRPLGEVPVDWQDWDEPPTEF
jgi:hypothetical protein